MTKYLIREWAAYIIVMVIAAWSIWPILRHPATAFAYGGDDALITWQINQTIQKIPSGLNRLFDGNIFYPYKNTAAFHMLLVPSAFLGFLPVKLTGNPVAAYNTAIILSQFLTLSVVFFWFRELTTDAWGSAIATVPFALSQIRMGFDVHIHMWIMHWLVLAAWLIWRYTQNKKIWQLYLAGLFLAIQIWESIYQAHWVMIFAVILLLPVRRQLRSHLKHLLVIFVAVLLLVLPVVGVYFSVFRQFGYLGSIRESAHFSMSLNDLWGKFLSPGLYLNLLIIALVVRKKSLSLRVFPSWLIWLLTIGLLFSLGPVLKWQDHTVKIFDKLFLPLPFGIFYYLAPGLSVLRSVHRYIWLAALAASGLVAVGFSRYQSRRRLILSITLLILAVLGGSTVKRDRQFPPPQDYPSVYSWLQGQPGQVILEYPVYTWADKLHGQEMYRMLYSLKHKKKMVNGASGFLPPERGALFSRIVSNYPNPRLQAELKALGVDYVIVHKNETSLDKLAQLAADPQLDRLWENPTSIVYALL